MAKLVQGPIETTPRQPCLPGWQPLPSEFSSARVRSDRGQARNQVQRQPRMMQVPILLMLMLVLVVVLVALIVVLVALVVVLVALGNRALRGERPPGQPSPRRPSWAWPSWCSLGQHGHERGRRADEPQPCPCAVSVRPVTSGNAHQEYVMHDVLVYLRHILDTQCQEIRNQPTGTVRVSCCV